MERYRRQLAALEGEYEFKVKCQLAEIPVDDFDWLEIRITPEGMYFRVIESVDWDFVCWRHLCDTDLAIKDSFTRGKIDGIREGVARQLRSKQEFEVTKKKVTVRYVVDKESAQVQVDK